MDSDFLIIGGGIAGLSAASRLVRHGRVIVVEAESALGYHSSGRSVSFSHFGIGNPAVRGLTAWSRPFFEAQPDGFCKTPISRLFPSVYLATEEMMPALEALHAQMALFTDAIDWIDEREMLDLCPVVKAGGDGFVRGVLDRSGLKLDGEALLQSYARAVRSGEGEIRIGRRIASIERLGEGWRITTDAGETLAAPVLINAAGAWADHIAAMAGVRPIGVRPLRRTIIVVDPPANMEIKSWPFVHTAINDFYMLPEAGQLLVSQADEVEDEPGDAQPEDYDVALAAYQLEQYTTLSVSRIAHRWAGLRSFVADRVPTAGFALDASGFFWLVGQGGYGLQTAPAMAEAVEALITGSDWPQSLRDHGITPEQIRPERLLNG